MRVGVCYGPRASWFWVLTHRVSQEVSPFLGLLFLICRWSFEGVVGSSTDPFVALLGCGLAEEELPKMTVAHVRHIVGLQDTFVR